MIVLIEAERDVREWLAAKPAEASRTTFTGSGLP